LLQKGTNEDLEELVQMQPQNPLIVRTAEESVSSIGDRMGYMRTWLDRNRIDLSGFQLVTIGGGNVAFDAQFRDLGHAALFRAAFGYSTPSALPQPVARRRHLPWRYRRAA
jgi:hypothetical protein